MKYSVLIFLFGIVLLLSCSEKSSTSTPNCDAQNAELARLKNQVDQQTQGQIQLNNLIISLTTSYMSIDSSLKILQVLAKERGKTSQFNAKAEEVEKFFVHAQTAIDSVESSLIYLDRDRTQSLVALEAIKMYLNYQQNLYVEVFSTISSYSGKIINLKTNLGTTIKNLKETQGAVSEKDRKLEQTKIERLRVYYITGEKEELVRAKVASKVKKGLGLKMSIQLSDKLDPGFFQEADLNQLTEIDLGNCKEPILLTNHPKDAYFINKSGGEAYLRITNPENFWSTTHFLVIQKD
jgi:hypothetical protein